MHVLRRRLALRVSQDLVSATRSGNMYAVHSWMRIWEKQAMNWTPPNSKSQDFASLSGCNEICKGAKNIRGQPTIV
jgi:hypothetical protein